MSTLGQQRVRLDYKELDEDTIEMVRVHKEEIAIKIDHLEQMKQVAESTEEKRAYAMAQTKLQEASYWITFGLTV